MSLWMIFGTQSWWRYSTPLARPSAILSRASKLTVKPVPDAAVFHVLVDEDVSSVAGKEPE
ncbi:hypothetical protein IEQ34_001054 [Dendrobium chrysotoxum]|uniref:Uncharacterized protein n=1 Tax=Dendrobium chrysotoxum TaxID=161865 RepID=A0AAV7HKJ9_DENCH|nr:hypothetical protein IEQ34_001054 [Dendrobium chrysotoxum]